MFPRTSPQGDGSTEKTARVQEPFGRLQGRRGEEGRYTVDGEAVRQSRFAWKTASSTVPEVATETEHCTWPPSVNGLHVSQQQDVARRAPPAEATESHPYLPASQKRFKPIFGGKSEAHCLHFPQYAVKSRLPSAAPTPASRCRGNIHPPRMKE